MRYKREGELEEIVHSSFLTPYIPGIRNEATNALLTSKSFLNQQLCSFIRRQLVDRILAL
jgi:hypothetical protein